MKNCIKCLAAAAVVASALWVAAPQKADAARWVYYGGYAPAPYPVYVAPRRVYRSYYAPYYDPYAVPVYAAPVYSPPVYTYPTPVYPY